MFFSILPVREMQSYLGEGVAHTREILWWKTIKFGIHRWRTVHLGKINRRVACYGESVAYGGCCDIFKTNDEQRAGIQDGSEGGEPGLAFVLRAIIGQNGIRKVAFQ